MAEKLSGETGIGQSKEKLAEGKVVLVLGASGLVGSRFVEMFGGPNVIVLTHDQLDITKPMGTENNVRSCRPDYIINFAAYTDVSRAQEEYRGLCWRINYQGVRNILNVIDPEETRFIQISTDYVFGGTPARPGPYTEDTRINTSSELLTWYGYSKAAAEDLVTRKYGDRATILRITYPVRANFGRKLDYLRGPLDFYKKNRRLSHPLFNNQHICITHIDEACEALKKIIEGEKYGVFHAASKNTTTPYELISYFLESFLRERPNVDSREMGDYVSRYPQYGGLDVAKTEEQLEMKFSYTVEIVHELLAQTDLIY